jgi:hypothetical protein
MRWDWGRKVNVGGNIGRNLVLRANKGAEQEVLRRMAGRNSHAELMTLRLDLESPTSEEIFIKRWREGMKNL